jgi:hypothetical protein
MVAGKISRVQLRWNSAHSRLERTTMRSGVLAVLDMSLIAREKRSKKAVDRRCEAIALKSGD